MVEQAMSTEVDPILLFSDAGAQFDLVAGISEKGSQIAVTRTRGGIILYDRSGHKARVGIDTYFSASDIRLSEEHCRGIVAMRDGSLIVEYAMTGGIEWVHSFSDFNLWEIDANDDLTRVCAVSKPVSGTGTIRYIDNGELVWTEPLADGSGCDIALSDDGAYLAVATEEYSPDPGIIETVGTAEVLLYEWGDRVWSESTPADVISIDVNTEQNTVVAGLDNGTIIAYNLEGNLLWEREGIPTLSKKKWEKKDQGGFISTSHNGEVVVSKFGPYVRAFDIRGNDLWETKVTGITPWGDWIEADQTGKRVIIGTSEGHVYLVESGTVVWKQSYDVGPARGAISADGNTWCVTIQDNDRQVIEVEAYQGGNRT